MKTIYVKHTQRLLRRFKKDTQGATAIEFAMLAVPFLALLFSIVELAIVFFIGSALNHAMAEAAREIRTGEFQSSCSQSAETFKTLVCSNMGSLGNCTGNLRFDVVKSNTGDFEANMMTPTPVIEDPDNPGQPLISPNTYTDSGPRDVVVIRAEYFHQLSLPGTLTRLSNIQGNQRLIASTTAFRNEPFPSTC